MRNDVRSKREEEVCNEGRCKRKINIQVTAWEVSEKEQILVGGKGEDEDEGGEGGLTRGCQGDGEECYEVTKEASICSSTLVGVTQRRYDMLRITPSLTPASLTIYTSYSSHHTHPILITDPTHTPHLRHSILHFLTTSTCLDHLTPTPFPIRTHPTHYSNILPPPPPSPTPHTLNNPRLLIHMYPTPST